MLNYLLKRKHMRAQDEDILQELNVRAQLLYFTTKTETNK